MNRFIHATMIVSFLFTAGTAMANQSTQVNDQRIQPWAENPFYWQYKGEPVLLLGGSDEDNLFNNPALMKDNFAIYQEVGGNYIRSTLSCRDEGNVWPFAKKNGKYDLNKFNPIFWDRLETSLREALKQGIILQIEVWATFDYYRDVWERNPFNPANNINYTTNNTKLKTKWNHHPAGKPQPFVFSIPKRNNDTVLLKYQEAFVRKMLDISLPFPNVLYCLDNETRAPQEWAHYWAEFIHQESKKQSHSVQLTEMWDNWDITHKDHQRTYDFPNLFPFSDISQNNWQIEQTHYDRILWYRTMLKNHPGGIRPINNVKVYQRQGGGKPDSPAISIDRWWQNIFGGCASTRFHRPTGGIGLNEQAQTTIKAARLFFSSAEVFRTEPRPDLLSNRDKNEAYCLASPGEYYALYFPKGGDVTLTIKKRKDPYQVLWFDFETATFVKRTTSKGDAGQVRLKSPDQSKLWLVTVD